MASTNKTTNYELSQYVGSDKPTYLGDYNSDMLKIDTAMHANATAIVTADEKATTAGTNASTALTNASTAQSTADTANTTATSALAKATANEANINKIGNIVKYIRLKGTQHTSNAGGTYSNLILNEVISNTLSDYIEMVDNNKIKAKKKCQIAISGGITFNTTMPNGSQFALMKNSLNPAQVDNQVLFRNLIDMVNVHQQAVLPYTIVDLEINDYITIAIYSPNSYETHDLTYFNCLLLRDLT